jgi:hypothetical protein
MTIEKTGCSNDAYFMLGLVGCRGVHGGKISA